MKWIVLAFLLLSIVFTVSGDGEIWEDDDHEVLVRNERGIQNKVICRYMKGSWSECDFKSNTRSRTLTLKKGDASMCEQTKVVQKKCKRGCRYEKSEWSQCKENGEMTRTDVLKTNNDAGCEPNRQITKKCPGNKISKENKEKGCRYEKSVWSQCKENGEMTRTDVLKANSDAGCEPNRQMTRKCPGNKIPKANKDKGSRRNRQ